MIALRRGRAGQRLPILGPKGGETVSDRRG